MQLSMRAERAGNACIRWDVATCIPWPTERQCLTTARRDMDPTSRPALASLAELTPSDLRARWPRWFDRAPPAKLRREFLVRALAYRIQERAAGGLSTAIRTQLRAIAKAVKHKSVDE